MVHILGIYIKPTKSIIYGLINIYGINIKTANKIIENVGIGDKTKINELTKDQIYNINRWIESNCLVTTDLKKFDRNNIQRLRDIRCYKGIRHKLSLPVNGQRTHTNSKTQKKLGYKRLK
jgi:small subunit ribosomal protein S13